MLGTIKAVLNKLGVFKKTFSFVRTIKMAAQPALTTSEEYFKEAGVISMNGNFMDQFLSLDVPAMREAKLIVRKLEVDLQDNAIIDELGGEKMAVISVSQFRTFLATNRKTKSSISKWLTFLSGRFLFYLKVRRNLWAVHVHWNDTNRGWDVDASSLRWRDKGCQVISLNSLF